MKLATLKTDFSFVGFAGDTYTTHVVVSSGTTIQVITDNQFARWLGGYHLSAPGGLFSFVGRDEVNDVVEFLDDETGHT